MKKSSKIIIGTVAVIGISFAAIGGMARYHFKHGFQENHANYMVERVTEELELNSEQIENLNVLKNKLMDKTKKMKAHKHDHKRQLLALFTHNTMDRNGAITMLQDKTNTIATEAPEVIHAIADFYDDLTIAQQSTVKEMLADKLQNHHHH